MKWKIQDLTNIQIEQITGISENLIGKYRRGYCKPSINNAALMEELGIAPAIAWRDFPSWLNSQTIPTQTAQPQVDEEKQNHTRSAA